jgi:metallo-beta-lactamase class B
MFFGQGHTSDNIIGYIPSENALFGGCLIKALGATKGNLTDANIREWSETVELIKKEISKLEIVIPGHEKNGGKELLEYTIELFE